MAKENVRFLYTFDEKKYPSKDYLNALEQMKELAEKYEECQHREIKEDKKNQSSEIYAKWHSLFKKKCLAPFPKKKEKKKVFVKWVDMSTLVDYGNVENEIHLKVMTPEMVLTDYLFYIHNDMLRERRYDGQDISSEGIDKLYKPYYYAFDQYDIESVDRSKLQKLKEKSGSDYGWFCATIRLDKNENEETSEEVRSTNSELRLRGKIFFSASKSETKDIIMDVANKVADPEVLKLLTEIDYIPDKNQFDTNVSPWISSITGNMKIEPRSFVRIYNVGQANCLYAYLYFQGQMKKKKIFFDVGRPFEELNHVPNPDLAGKTVMSDNLIHIVRCKPDLIILSHWHTDHVLGALSLGRYAYDEFNDSRWIAPLPDDNVLNMFHRLIKFLIIKKKIRFVDPKNVINGIVDDSGDFKLYRGQGTDINSSCLMLRLKNTLFSGDCMYQYWPQSLQNDIDKIEQMVIPHHGAALKPNDETIIKGASKLHRQMAVICTGENIYAHPEQRHIKELSQTLRFSTVYNFKNMKNVPFIEMYIV